MFVHIAYTLHAFSFDTSLCAYKQEWQLIYNALKPNYALFRTKVLMVIAKNQNIINGEWAAESGWRRKKKKKKHTRLDNFHWIRAHTKWARAISTYTALGFRHWISNIKMHNFVHRKQPILRYLFGWKNHKHLVFFCWFCILLYRICFV